MKTKIIFFGVMLIAFSAVAYLTMSFPGWDVLTEKSSDIVVVHCINVQDPFNSKKDGHPIDFQGLVDSDFEIVSVLKGTKNTGIVRISSEYWPQQGSYYLLFQDYRDGRYQGLEEYRVVPLGAPFYTNSIAGKPLDKQLQILFRHANNYLNSETQKDQETKDRLEQALQK